MHALVLNSINLPFSTFHNFLSNFPVTLKIGQGHQNKAKMCKIGQGHPHQVRLWKICQGYKNHVRMGESATPSASKDKAPNMA